MSRMNAGIILSGRQPDFVNTLAQSTRAAALANANDRQQQQNALYQQHGQGLLNGDPNALNALAQFDAPQALQVQQAQQQRELAQRKFEFDERRFDFQIQQFEAQATAAQKAEAAAAARKDAFMLGAAQSPEEFDQIAQEIGEPELVGGFEQRDLIVRKHMTAAELLEAGKEEKPADEYGRYAAEERAAGREPLSRIDYKRAGQKNMRVTSDGEGGFTVEETFGNQPGGKPPSERQSTLRLFGGLMNETMPAINAMEDDPNFNPVSARSAAAGGGIAGNVVTSPEARKYEALKRQWAEGVLRIQTGAAATQPEIERVVETYFPRFGDDPETVAQKRQQRDAFARSLVEASGNTMPAPGGADTRGAIGETNAPQPEPSFEFQSDEQRQIFEKYQ